MIACVQSPQIVSKRQSPRLSEVLTLADAAKQLGLAHATLRRQIHNGRLQAVKVGTSWVITEDELKRYREEHQGQGRRSDLEE